MGIIGWITLGLVAGAVANAPPRGEEHGGVLGALAVGILGALAGGLIGSGSRGTARGAWRPGSRSSTPSRASTPACPCSACALSPTSQRPGWARPGQARPGQARPGQARPGQGDEGGGARWTAQEDRALRRLYAAGRPVTEIAVALGRSADAVTARRRQLVVGVVADHCALAERAGLRGRRGLETAAPPEPEVEAPMPGPMGEKRHARFGGGRGGRAPELLGDQERLVM